MYIPRVCREIVNQTPYRNMRNLRHYLYLSVMLTLIFDTLASSEDKKRKYHKTLVNRSIDSDELANQTIAILYHLP